MRRITVVLNVLSCRRVRQSVLVFVAKALHQGEHGVFLRGVGDAGRCEGCGEVCGEVRRGVYDEVGGGLERDGRVGDATEDALDGGGGVEARGYCAAESFDPCNGVGRGAGDDDVDC
jgi:hypothetical protein